ncbi:hypothetical protein N9N67_11345 [Bacteriovoracaceae bacterium]|nr:hypothetical protein [Bacteriovoracaceae bacterium]
MESSEKILKFDNLEICLKTDKKVIELQLFGDIDRYFPTSIDEIKETRSDLNIMFLNIRNINSTGIRNFLMFLADFKKSVKINYFFCPPIFIDQCNVVKGLISTRRQVKSLQLPYFDEKVNQEVLINVNVDEIQDGAPPQQSDSGRDLIFNKNQQLFFMFLKRQNATEE